MIGPMHAPTEPEMVAYLVSKLANGTIMPHYTPQGWWECDVAHFSKANYLTEYEIKVSLADFKADARKAKRLHWSDRSKTSKYNALESGAGPKYFWYVVPRNMILPEDVPPFAGLMWAEWHQAEYFRTLFTQGYKLDYDGGPWFLRMRKIKDAPSLGRHKFSQSVVDHCAGVAYYRYLNAIAKESKGLGSEGIH